MYHCDITILIFYSGVFPYTKSLRNARTACVITHTKILVKAKFQIYWNILSIKTAWSNKLHTLKMCTINYKQIALINFLTKSLKLCSSTMSTNWCLVVFRGCIRNTLYTLKNWHETHNVFSIRD